MRFNPFNNLTLKIGAVLLALLLWVHVATNKAYEYQLEGMLALTNVPAGLVLVSDFPSTVTLRVKATGKQLIALAAKDIVVRVDASEFREGSIEHDLTDRIAAAAFDQVYERVEIAFPRKLFLRFERVSEKNVLIGSEVKAKPADGYLIAGRPRIEPEMIRVSGPATVIRNLKKISTAAVELNGLTTSTSHKVRLMVPDSLHLSLSDSSVSISLNVEPMAERLLDSLAIRAPLDFDASRYTYYPKLTSVRVGFPSSLRDSLDWRQIRASFEADDDYRDSTRIAIKYSLPVNVVLVGNPLDSVQIHHR